MSNITHVMPAWSRAAPIAILLAISSSVVASAKQTSEGPVVRWSEGKPGSTFTATDDGKYLYSLRDGNLEIVIAIDSQELEKVHHRPLPIMALRIDAHYAGKQSLNLTTDHISLEFVRHDRVVNTSLDPDDLSAHIQNDADNLNDETEHEVRKHPEKKQEQETLLQAHLKDMTDLMGFVSVHGLRAVSLDTGNPEASGWVFFSTKSKWIGGWKPQEDFILRIPFQNRIFEFPFSLPPRKGMLVLRRRDE